MCDTGVPASQPTSGTAQLSAKDKRKIWNATEQLMQKKARYEKWKTRLSSAPAAPNHAAAQPTFVSITDAEKEKLQKKRRDAAAKEKARLEQKRSAYRSYKTKMHGADESTWTVCAKPTQAPLLASPTTVCTAAPFQKDELFACFVSYLAALKTAAPAEQERVADDMFDLCDLMFPDVAAKLDELDEGTHAAAGGASEERAAENQATVPAPNPKKTSAKPSSRKNSAAYLLAKKARYEAAKAQRSAREERAGAVCETGSGSTDAGPKSTAGESGGVHAAGGEERSATREETEARFPVLRALVEWHAKSTGELQHDALFHQKTLDMKNRTVDNVLDGTTTQTDVEKHILHGTVFVPAAAALRAGEQAAVSTHIGLLGVGAWPRDDTVRIVVVGDTFGGAECKEQRMYGGESGEKLAWFLKQCGGHSAYLTTVMRIQPLTAAGTARQPANAEVFRHMAVLKKELEILRPALVVALGKFAYNCIEGLFAEDKVAKLLHRPYDIGSLAGERGMVSVATSKIAKFSLITMLSPAHAEQRGWMLYEKTGYYTKLAQLVREQVAANSKKLLTMDAFLAKR